MGKRLTFILVLFVLLTIIGCNKKEAINDYKVELEKVAILINKEKWEESKALLEKIPNDYNNTVPLIKNYVEAKLILSSSNGSEFDKAKNALSILEHTKLDSRVTNSTIKQINDLKDQLSTQVNNAIQEAEPREKAVVDEAYNVWNEATKINGEKSHYDLELLVKNYDTFITKFKEDAQILYVYANMAQLRDQYRENQTTEDAYGSNGNYDNYRSYGREFADNHKMEMTELIKDINPNTEGASDFTPEILWNLKAGLENFFEISEEDWLNLYNDYEGTKGEFTQEIENRDRLKTMTPQIGMTKEEVALTKWGEPEDINKTTTTYGVNEQWVYENYKYLYFEDGILVTIQE